ANDVMGYIEGLETRKQINDAISELPAKCREVFILSYQHDKKNKEIAEQLGISIRTVEVHLYKALKTLRTRLKRHT
ncbi:MAG: sigma-70 family RNA polymerase sigma factor, partial [Segatella salivae]